MQRCLIALQFLGVGRHAPLCLQHRCAERSCRVPWRPSPTAYRNKHCALYNPLNGNNDNWR